MARVVIVWNEHPTEVVGGFHARKVAEILRNKFNHEVIMEKIPRQETNYEILAKMPEPNLFQRAAFNLEKWIDKKWPWKFRRLKIFLMGAYSKATLAAIRHRAEINKSSSIGLAEDAAKRHQTYAFNFHCSPAHGMGQATTREAKDFEVGRTTVQPRISPTEILFHNTRDEKASTIEVPAFFENMPKRVFRKRSKRYRFVYDLDHELNSPEGAKSRLYLLQRTPLHHPQQHKYIDRTISEKIAAAIHERITANSTKPRRT